VIECLPVKKAGLSQRGHTTFNSRADREWSLSPCFSVLLAQENGQTCPAIAKLRHRWALAVHRDLVYISARRLGVAAMSLDLQPVRAEDEAFLFELYASTRADEMALVGWDKPQQESFLRMQFKAQQSSYAMQFPNADYRIIVHDGRVAGRLIVDRSGEDILLIDIALLPEFRSAGIGSVLMKQLMVEAAGAQKPIKLHVETFNRARRLYERLGFRPTGDNGIYLEMVWKPESGASLQSGEIRP
jgi:ribosomal protein S18 acetylase RimI-like enzyme